MNPDQRESLERKNPHRYGGLGLVSIYVHECQTLLFCVNLYCSKPNFSPISSFDLAVMIYLSLISRTRNPCPGTAKARDSAGWWWQGVFRYSGSLVASSTPPSHSAWTSEPHDAQAVVTSGADSARCNWPACPQASQR